jgi:radical SAM superfamily enzyme YgiQ (UPF0313 family)
MKNHPCFTRNLRVALHWVDQGVWGLYHLDEGTFAFVDDLGKLLLEFVPQGLSPDALISACTEDFAGSDLNVVQALSERLEILRRFGAIVSVSDGRDAEVLLIDPPCHPRMVGTYGPAKGLCYLSQSLRQSGLNPAKILDLRSVSRDVGTNPRSRAAYLTRYLAPLNPQVVGITAVSATIDSALFVGNLVKNLFPEAFLVLGGPHASYEWRALLERCPFLDAIVVGEGELSFPRLVERVAEAHEPDFRDIQGIAWRDRRGIVMCSGWSHGLEDLDSMSFPDDRVDLINASDYDIGYARIISARGCPFKCSFCSTAEFTGRRMRERSIAGIVEEVRFYWNKYAIKGFSFDDDIFTVNRKRAVHLCEALAAAEFAGRLTWGCNTRMDCIDNELIDVMHRAGCRYILFGIESGDPDVQARFGKGKRSLVGFREKVVRMIDRGIEPQLNFILGLPGESPESIHLIADLLEGLPQVNCTFNFLNIFPGTPLAQQLQELGIELLSDAADVRYSLTAPTLNTRSMSADEQVEAYLRLEWFRTRQAAALPDLNLLTYQEGKAAGSLNA